MRDPLPADRWASIDALFEAAAEMPAARRESFLNEACGDDRRLRDEVLLLLKYDTGSGDIDEGSGLLAALQAGAASVVSEQSAVGRMLGPWRIEREIGRGGMAVVYLGSRADGAYRKQVAIKLIKRGMDTTAVVARLYRERRILAALDHPCIARLLDGGATPDGLPYIVMEYVEGVTIDRYCDERRLGVEERCELMGKVCDAVAYAHRNLVVHRDLKPGNVLVGQDGIPKLLDFGIAKLLRGDGSGMETRGVARPLTPEYASPEQIGGGSVGTATDVYSLGVVLYELLAGARPGPDGENAEKASAAALRSGRGKRWSGRLAGDLDNILLMALRAEPERRYLSVGQLQADLSLHLRGLPVAARDETLFYRTGKFLRRHRLGALAALLIVLSLTGGMAATLWQARRAEAERRIADRRFAQVRELAGRFLFDFHDAIASLPGSTPARRMVVETGIRYYDSLVKEAGGNRDLLEEIARGYDRLGDVQGNPYYANLGDMAGAADSYRKALAVRAKIADASPEFLRDRIAGEVRRAQILLSAGDYPMAESILKRAMDFAAGPESRQPAIVRDVLAAAWSAMGDAELRSGANGEAAGSYSKLLALRLDLARENADSDAAQRAISVAQMKLGDAYYRSDRPEESLPHLRAARELDQRFAAAAPGNMALTRRLKVSSLSLGLLLFSTGKHLARPGEAIAILKDAVSLADRELMADPENRQALRDVADSGTALGDALRDEKDFKGARAAWDHAMAAAQKLAHVDGNAGILSQLYRRIAIASGDAGQYEAAMENLRKAEEYADAAEKAAPASMMRAMRQTEINGTREDIYVARKRWQEAIALIKSDIAAYRDMARRDPSNQMLINEQPGMYATLAACYAGAGDRGNAVKAMRAAVALYDAIAKTRALLAAEKQGRDDARAKLAAWTTRP